MGISIGLVGLGQFGKAFAPLFKAHPLVDRVGLCDREAERVRKFADDPFYHDKFDERDAYASLDDICASDLDALVIITQPWLHAAQAVQAMEAGKHAYSAVPIVSLPDGDEILDWCGKLVDTCRRTGMRYMLGETTFYRPEAMFCRRKAAEGAFGQFVHSEGEYFHDVDSRTNLRRVNAARADSAAGREWQALKQHYVERGVKNGPMHYPTHSTSGPMCVMDAHAVKVCAWGTPPPQDDDYFADSAFSNETALFRMSNGSTMRVCECRKVSASGEVFRIYGTLGSYRENSWIAAGTVEGQYLVPASTAPLTAEEMRDPLPDEVAREFKRAYGDDEEGDFVPKGHGGSHPYLVHEFVEAVAAGRQPAINAWEACRYMAAGVMAHKSCLKDGEVLDVPDWGDAEG